MNQVDCFREAPDFFYSPTPTPPLAQAACLALEFEHDCRCAKWLFFEIETLGRGGRMGSSSPTLRAAVSGQEPMGSPLLLAMVARGSPCWQEEWGRESWNSPGRGGKAAQRLRAAPGWARGHWAGSAPALCSQEFSFLTWSPRTDLAPISCLVVPAGPQENELQSPSLALHLISRCQVLPCASLEL